MQQFYQNISQQNDQLKGLLEKTDFSKIQQMKGASENLAEQTEPSKLVKSNTTDELVSET